MGKIILENVTPDEVSQKLQDAGVRPGERVTVEVHRHGDPDSLITVVEGIRASAEANGMTDEDLIDLLELKPGEFENLYGRPPVRRAAS